MSANAIAGVVFAVCFVAMVAAMVAFVAVGHPGWALVPLVGCYALKITVKGGVCE